MKAANYTFEGAHLFAPDKLRNPSIQPQYEAIERDKLIIDPGVHTIASGHGGPVVMKGDVSLVLKKFIAGRIAFRGLHAEGSFERC